LDGGAWKRGPAPKAQPIVHKTAQYNRGLKSSWRICFWRTPTFFILLPILGAFTIFSQTTPILVEFVEEKKEKTVFAITLARENHSGRNFGHFWVSSTFWSHWSRFQSHWRSFAGVFSSGKLSGPPGPFQCWSCLEAMLSHFW